MRIGLCIVFFCFQHLLPAQNRDVRLLTAVYADSSGGRDQAAKWISVSVAPVSAAAPAAMLIVGFIKKDSVLLHNGIKTGGALVLNTLLSFSLKYAVKRERPFQEYPLLFHAKQSAGGYSFPSQHSSTAFSTATALSLAYPKWYVIAPAYAWACASAYSRMYLGVHYPSDVLAGALLGSASAFLSFKIEKWLFSRKQHG